MEPTSGSAARTETPVVFAFRMAACGLSHAEQEAALPMLNLMLDQVCAHATQAEGLKVIAQAMEKQTPEERAATKKFLDGVVRYAPRHRVATPGCVRAV